MCAANFKRCDSPPESVVNGWPKRTYSSPTACSGAKAISDFRRVFKKLQRLGNGQVENLANIFTAVGDFQNFFAETAAVALGTGGIHVGEKLHLDFFITLAAAGFTAPTLDVERKGRRRVAAQARQIGAGEQPPDAVEGFHISRRIGARRGAHRRLIDEQDFGDLCRCRRFWRNRLHSQWALL